MGYVGVARHPGGLAPAQILCHRHLCRAAGGDVADDLGGRAVFGAQASIPGSVAGKAWGCDYLLAETAGRAEESVRLAGGGAAGGPGGGGGGCGEGQWERTFAG